MYVTIPSKVAFKNKAKHNVTKNGKISQCFELFKFRHVKLDMSKYQSEIDPYNFRQKY